jgi:hypothetical protein
LFLAKKPDYDPRHVLGNVFFSGLPFLDCPFRQPVYYYIVDSEQKFDSPLLCLRLQTDQTTENLQPDGYLAKIRKNERESQALISD